jgi:voltage-gated potassium channel
VVSPYVIGARRMAGAVLRPAVLDFLDSVMHTGQVAISLEALQIPAGSGLLGKALRDLDIKERTGAVAIARMHADGTLDTRLRGEVEFAEGDTLIVLGTAEQLAALGEMARPRGTAAT